MNARNRLTRFAETRTYELAIRYRRDPETDPKLRWFFVSCDASSRDVALMMAGAELYRDEGHHVAIVAIH